MAVPISKAHKQADKNKKEVVPQFYKKAKREFVLRHSLSSILRDLVVDNYPPDFMIEDELRQEIIRANH